VRGGSTPTGRLFPATIDQTPEAKGRYRWRAVCQFGKRKGGGTRELYQLQAIAINKETIKSSLSAQAITNAVKTDIISVKRTK
jgi:hypothetical protein